MPTFKQIAKAFNTIANNLDVIFERIFTKEKIVIEITRAVKERLFFKGDTGTGVELKTDGRGGGYPYAISTVEEVKPPGRWRGKGQTNLPFDRVTLFNETGIFYASFDVVATRFMFEIKGDFEKGKDSHIYTNFQDLFSSEKEFEKSVMSITVKELSKILEKYANIEIDKEIKKIIKSA